MTNPLVHIGYHKTATTWFQQCFYPKVASHHYVQRKEVKNALLYPHAFAFDPSVARERLGLAWEDIRPPLLCEEELSGSFQTGGHMGALSKELAERIHQVLPQARIVVFIRHQVDIIAAAYAQYIKSGGTYGPERFLFPTRYYRKGLFRQPYKKPLFAFDHFAYLGLIRHYRMLFGTDRVHVFPCEAFQSDPRAFCTEYAERLGLVVDLDQVNFGAANASYRHRTLRLARALNHLTYRNVVDKRYLASIISHKYINRLLKCFDRTPFAGRRLFPRELLGDDTVAFIEDYYAEGNRALMQETDLSLVAYSYPGTTDREFAGAGAGGDAPD